MFLAVLTTTTNILQGEFFVEKPLHSVLNAMVSWFIMVTTYIPKKGLETSKSVDISVQIVTTHRKKIVVSGKVLNLFFLIQLTISSNYLGIIMFLMKEFLLLWISYIQDQKALFSENSIGIWGKRKFCMTKMFTSYTMTNSIQRKDAVRNIV